MGTGMIENKYWVLFYLTLHQTGNALMDATIDALMVVQARIDPENGAQQLQRLSWTIYPLAMLIGSFLAAPFTQHYHPMWSYLIMAAVLAVIIVFSFRLEENNDRLEKDEDGNIVLLTREPFCNVVKSNFRTIYEAMFEKHLRGVLLFLIISIPLDLRFVEIMYYYNIDVVGFT